MPKAAKLVICGLIFLLILLCLPQGVRCHRKEAPVTVEFFHSPTCHVCSIVEEWLGDVIEQTGSKLVVHDVTNMTTFAPLQERLNAVSLPDSLHGVPALFVNGAYVFAPPIAMKHFLRFRIWQHTPHFGLPAAIDILPTIALSLTSLTMALNPPALALTQRWARTSPLPPRGLVPAFLASLSAVWIASIMSLAPTFTYTLIAGGACAAALMLALLHTLTFIGLPPQPPLFPPFAKAILTRASGPDTAAAVWATVARILGAPVDLFIISAVLATRPPRLAIPIIMAAPVIVGWVSWGIGDIGAARGKIHAVCACLSCICAVAIIGQV